MKQQEVFGRAVWLDTGEADAPQFPVLRGHFTVRGVKTATLRVLGLGFFHCYINGRRVGDDLFLPLNTDYEPRTDYPVGETLSGHRIYVPAYDVTDYLQEGDNVIAIHFGGGWYTYGERSAFGRAKAIWRLFGEDADGAFDHVSSTADRIADSFVCDYNFTTHECHDYTRACPEAVAAAFDDSAWSAAAPAPALDTDYLFCDCPPDRVRATLPAAVLGQGECGTVYDCGVNTTGYPVLRLTAPAGQTVQVRMAEEAEGTALHPRFIHGQRLSFVSDGTPRTVRPLFTWFGFRYFEVCGAAEVLGVETVHTDVRVTSSFSCDNALLDWIHDTYLNTQLTNMHAGIPSDCPHLERRGYTGDGQLACHAAMNMLDAKAFYRKWIEDIADCRDVATGHIQYTAPYMHSGGGPGGWGCAIVEVPYQYYKHYGDAAPLYAHYAAMLCYFDYLEAHSYGELVVSDKAGEWCLGDWCTPTDIILPAPFVNNYFYIKSLQRCIEIAAVIGRQDDIPRFEQTVARRKEALVAAYFNCWDGNFLGNRQGANAFALDIGLGDHRTYGNLVRYYRNLGRYDTGIFGTELVTRLFFERGDADLAVSLMTSTADISFDGMRRAGATTLWEYFPHSLVDRSHNHPMFGAVTACLYDYLCGIGQAPDSAGYQSIVIAPVAVQGLDRVEGRRTLPCGEVAVEYEKTAEGACFTVTVPAGANAVFVWDGQEHTLAAGRNRFVF